MSALNAWLAELNWHLVLILGKLRTAGASRATTRWVGIIKNKRQRIVKSTMGNPQWQSKLFSKVSWMWPMLPCLLACLADWPATKVCTLIKFLEMAAWRVARWESSSYSGKLLKFMCKLHAHCPSLDTASGQWRVASCVARGRWHVANWWQSLKLLQFL